MAPRPVVDMHSNCASSVGVEVTVDDGHGLCRGVAAQATLRQTLLKAREYRQQRVPLTMIDMVVVCTLIDMEVVCTLIVPQECVLR